jgi:hypothetical protein
MAAAATAVGRARQAECGNRKLALKPAVARYHATQALPSRPKVS